jgi:hypothetical protein
MKKGTIFSLNFIQYEVLPPFNRIISLLIFKCTG